MTQDEIIDIYKEVSNKLCNGTEWCWAGVGEPLQLFAKLVAAKERADEREACAKIAETPISGEQDDITMEAKDRVAKAIRARANAERGEQHES